MFGVRVHPRVVKSAPRLLKPAHLKRFMEFLRDAKENPLPDGYDVKPLSDRKILGLNAYRLNDHFFFKYGKCLSSPALKKNQPSGEK